VKEKLKNRRVLAYFKWSLILILGLAGISNMLSVFLTILLILIISVSAWMYLPFFLMALPFILPFQPAINPGADYDLAAGRLLILVLFAVGYLQILIYKKKWFSLTTPTILILLFLFISAFSGIVAENTDWYLRKLLVFISLFPVYFLVLAFLKKKSQWLKLTAIWAYTTLIVSVLGIIQFFLQFVIGTGWFLKLWGKVIGPILYGQNLGEAVASNPSWLVSSPIGTLLRAISTFPDPHILAFYLGMSIPIQIVFAYTSKKNLWLLPIISFITLLLTFSRGGYVGLIGVLILGIIAVLKYFPEKRAKIISSIIGILILSFFIQPIQQRFLSIVDINEGSNKGRLEIWSESLDISLNNPLLGTGLGNYVTFARPEADYREPIYAHNTYLDIASETGLLGFLTWFSLLIWGILPVLKLPIKVKKSFNSLELWNLAAAFSILWFSLHSFFETPIFSPRILPLLLILLAFRVFIESKKEKSNL